MGQRDISLGFSKLKTRLKSGSEYKLLMRIGQIRGDHFGISSENETWPNVVRGEVKTSWWRENMVGGSRDRRETAFYQSRHLLLFALNPSQIQIKKLNEYSMGAKERN